MLSYGRRFRTGLDRDHLGHNARSGTITSRIWLQQHRCRDLEEEFQRIAAKAKGMPVSKAYDMEITLEATLAVGVSKSYCYNT